MPCAKINGKTIEPQDGKKKNLGMRMQNIRKTVQPWVQNTEQRKKNNTPYYPTALRRVPITPKTSTYITRYLSSTGPVRQVFSQRASDELD